MSEFLQNVVAFPTAIYSALLAFVLIYWTFVIVGVVELKEGADLDADADADLDLDGGKGGIVGGGKGGLVGGKAGGLDADGDADADAEGEGKGGMVGMLKSLGLSGVPITVIFSLLVLYAWMASILGQPYAVATGVTGVALTALLFGVGFVAAMIAIPIAALSIRPLRPLFYVKPARRRHSLVGMTCEIQTERVGPEYGRAEVHDGEAGLLIDVGAPEANSLTRGSMAVIYDYDAEDERFLVADHKPSV